MELDARTNQLFIEILNNPDETSTSLKKRHDLTRSQLSYSLQKVNEYLDELNLDPVTRTTNGHFIITKKNSRRICSKQFANHQGYVFITRRTHSIVDINAFIKN
ncbi:hypothetical protein TEHN7128_1301 [Tetragenococcus halophilus subsp. halophilus]|uniref:hypothetical protein n=1 Tax=Tetragenococcus halophilus TaxID=51669 RepID=UPI000CABE4DA|nr:hypothetical protein [Tetragenococcus halophilus]GBD65734.1 hypothetical protein TEHN7116_0698 [Tetragenococcus halophilus subsp. halophilus]GBD78072.1 hypothetical protein TEHN7128_1301 [Tetragenococcus halophilus subsp. halophilus]GMG65275.1 hypothetical protein TEHIT2_04660 [Tetragenococcus halophilus]GMQ73729.1 hypothetical protein TEHSL10_13630 [Tetragenococcus halophilus]